jgi:hypothetical protein
MDMDYNRTTSSATRKDTESASVVKFDASAGTEKSSFKQSGDLK